MTARLAATALVFVAAALVVGLGMDRYLGVYDEGVILTGAMRMAAGDVPHGDFYANYGPGAFLPAALLFKAFGEAAWLERAYDVVVRAAIVALSYYLVAGVARRRTALACAAAALLWMFGIGFPSYPAFPVIALGLAAAALVQPALGGAHAPWRTAAAGALASLAALVRYDMGFVLFLALAAVLALSGIAKAVRFTLGTAAVFVPATLAYLAAAPASAFFHDIFEFSIPNYARRRSLPFPGLEDVLASLDNLAVYASIAAAALAGFALLARGARRPWQRWTPADWLLATFAALTLVFYLKGLVRVSPIHLMGAIVASLVVLALLVDSTMPRATRFTAGALAAAMLAATLNSAATAGVKRAVAHSTMLARVLAWTKQPPGTALCGAPPRLERIRCLLLDPDREEAASFVAANTQPGERIYVGLGRHDKIFVNDNVLYFAAGRMPATRWHHFDSGLQTRADIQAAIVAELRAHAVRYAVIETIWDDFEEPNESARSSGVHLLDDYLRREFRVVKAFGDVAVLVRE
jgi:hypothetical protein